MTQSPEIAALALDLVAKDLPILETKELTKRIRKQMISNGVVEPTEQEVEELGLNEPQQPDPQQVAVTDNINMQTTKLQAEIEKSDASTAETMVKAQGEVIDSYNKLVETFKVQIEAGIPFSEADRALLVKQRDLVMESQQALDEGPNSEQAASIVNNAAAQEQANEAENARVLTVQQPSASIGQDDLNG